MLVWMLCPVFELVDMLSTFGYFAIISVVNCATEFQISI
jgi:hypothetical protein